MASISHETLERAAATKAILLQHRSVRRLEMLERRNRQEALSLRLCDPMLMDAERQALVEAFEARERELLRASRKRYRPTDFERLALLGRGSYAEVYLVRCGADVYAMKIQRKLSSSRARDAVRARAERDALVGSGDETSVTRLHFSFQDDSHIYLILDYCPGGDLMGLLMREGVLAEDAVRVYAAEIATGIAAIHELGYLHRDLKPDNVLLDAQGHLRLADLGLCKKIATGGNDEEEEYTAGTHNSSGGACAATVLANCASGVTSSTPVAPVPPHRALAFSVVGTPDYIAPEVLQGSGYGQGADWWSLGAILFECLFGYAPFASTSAVVTVERILHWRDELAFPSERASNLSPDCMDFIRRLLSEAESRLGVAGGIDELRGHPWLATLDWEHLRSAPPPFMPAACRDYGELVRALAATPTDDPALLPIIMRLTASFECSRPCDRNTSNNIEAGGGDASAPEQQTSRQQSTDPTDARELGSRRAAARFVGYTYTRERQS